MTIFGSFCGPRIVIRFLPDGDPDPGDPKRPAPTGFGSGSATLILTLDVGLFILKPTRGTRYFL